MSDGYLNIEDGQVSLGGNLVPGELASMRINGAVRFDQAEVDNLSGTKKTPLGWEDSLITIKLLLMSDENGTCYEKLADMNRIFKGLDSSANPKVYDLVNSHTSARGIDQVVFNGLRSREGNQDDTILTTLDFCEHNPPTIPPEIRTSAADTTTAPGADDSDSSQVVDATVTQDPDSPFAAGFKDGTA